MALTDSTGREIKVKSKDYPQNGMSAEEGFRAVLKTLGIIPRKED